MLETTTILGVTPDQATQYIWNWWWVVCAGLVVIGMAISQIKNMFKDD